MAKHLTEEELQSDPLLSTYAKIQEFYLSNKNVIIGSAVAVILAISLAIGYHYYQRSQNQKAQQLMGMAESYYLRGDYQQALHGSEENLTRGFEQIIREYGGTEAGNLARYYAAVSAYNLGNTKQALEYINNYEVPEGILGVAPLSFKGVLLTELGNHEEAAATYVKAAEWDVNDATTPYNYLEAARAFHDAGNMQQAEKYARLVAEDYPASSQVAEAKKLIGQLMTANESGSEE